MHQTQDVIEDIINASCKGEDTRTRYLMRESLRNLVLMAKSEQILEIRNSGAKLMREYGKKMIQTTYISP